MPKDGLFINYELAVAKRVVKLRHHLELEGEGLDLLDEVKQPRAENQMLKQWLGRLVVE